MDYRDELKAEMKKLDGGEREVEAIENKDKFVDEVAEDVDRTWRDARELKNTSYEFSSYAELSKEESDEMDEWVKVKDNQALQIASLTGDPDAADIPAIWRDLMPEMSPNVRNWTQKYILRPQQGEAMWKTMIKDIIRDAMEAGMARDIVMKYLFPDSAKPNPQNPDKVLFVNRHWDDLNKWFPEDFPMSREKAASGVIPISVIEQAAAS